MPFFRKSRRLKEGVVKYGTAGQAKDDNTTHAHRMLNNQGYRHTLRIFHNYCFYIGKIVTRTRLNVTFTRTLPMLFLFMLKVGVESRYIVCCSAFLPLKAFGFDRHQWESKLCDSWDHNDFQIRTDFGRTNLENIEGNKV
jgi:hypothetical protein